jgi:hypothetical protein
MSDCSREDLLYLRKHWSYFAALFVIATINRETTLLLLPLYLLNQAVEDGRLQPRLLLRPRSLALVLTLSFCWTAWQLLLHHQFAHNPSEFYPRINWNVKSLLVPQAWPQMLSGCGYLMRFVALMSASESGSVANGSVRLIRPVQCDGLSATAIFLSCASNDARIFPPEKAYE